MRACWAGVCLGVLVLQGIAAGAAAGRAAGAAAEYTQNDFYTEALAFNRAELVDGYKARGKRDAKWDGAAIAALELAVTYFSQYQVAEVAYPVLYPDAKVTVDELGTAAQRAIDAGAVDPVIYYLRGVALSEQGHLRQAQTVFTQAEAALAGAPYSAFQRFKILDHVRVYVAEDKDAAWSKVEAAGFEMAKGPFLNRAAQRVIGVAMRTTYEYGPKQLYAGKLARLANSGVDPWIAQYITTVLETSLAWESRGGGFASTVTLEGGRGFAEHLAKAAKAGNAAFKIHPEFPEVPTAMITVAMGGGGKEEVLQWFDRAIAAEPDYHMAYRQVCNGLLPRWGGSLAEILAVGKKAAATQRYDTSIPYEYLMAAAVVAGDPQGDPKIFMNADVKKLAGDTIGQYRTQWKDNAQASAFFQTSFAVMRYVATNWPLARQTIDELKSDPDPMVFGSLGQSMPDALRKIYLEGAADQADVTRFEDALSAFNFRNAQAALDAIVAKDKPTGRTAEYFASMKAGCRVLQDYRANQVINLTDPATAALWRAEHPLMFDSGMLIAPFDTGLHLTSRFFVPDRHYELHLKLKILDRYVEPTYPWDGVRISFGIDPSAKYWGLTLFANPPHALLESPGNDALSSESEALATVKYTLQEVNSIDVIYFDGVPKVTLNGVVLDFSSANAKTVAAMPKKNSINIHSGLPLEISEFTWRHLAAQP